MTDREELTPHQKAKETRIRNQKARAARLEKQRQELLRRQELQRTRPRPEIGRLRFDALDFEQKKAVAAQFIHEIRLDGDSAEVIWNI